MDRTMKKVNYKKQLVRNPIKDCTKGVVTRETRPVSSLDINDIDFSEEVPQSLKKKTFSVPDIDESMKRLDITPREKPESLPNINQDEGKCRLDVPSIHSSLNIGKKIDKLSKVKQSSLKPVIQKKTFNEKLTRQVNFPYEKKIFRDLMPLSSPSKHIPSLITSREPIPPKDKEPMLEDFIETPEIQEHIYIPNMKLETRRSRAHCNNLHLYKMLQFLEQC